MTHVTVPQPQSQHHVTPVTQVNVIKTVSDVTQSCDEEEEAQGDVTGVTQPQPGGVTQPCGRHGVIGESGDDFQPCIHPCGRREMSVEVTQDAVTVNKPVTNVTNVTKLRVDFQP